MGSDRKWKIEEVEVKGEKFDLVTLPRPTVVPFGSLINIFLHQVRMAARAGGKVFVREDGKSSGGLIMPDNARSVVQSVTATVISVGPSCVQLLPGDEIVLLGGGMSAFLIHRGQKTMMCR